MNSLDFLKQIRELLFDNSTSWGKFIAKFISIIVFLLIFDFLLSFTYNIHISNKLEQLGKITLIKSEYKKDSINNIQIEKLEKQILNKEHYYEFLPRIFSKISFNQEIKAQKINQEITESTNIIKPIFSVFWMTLSSNLLIIIILPFLIFLPAYNKDSRSGNGIASWISSVAMLCLMISFVTWIFYQIPLILENPVYNYVLNFLVQTLFWILIIKIGNKRNKKN
jgi:ATP-dependent Zn protease